MRQPRDLRLLDLRTDCVTFEQRSIKKDGTKDDERSIALFVVCRSILDVRDSCYRTRILAGEDASVSVRQKRKATADTTSATVSWGVRHKQQAKQGGCAAALDLLPLHLGRRERRTREGGRWNGRRRR